MYIIGYVGCVGLQMMVINPQLMRERVIVVILSVCHALILEITDN